MKSELQAQLEAMPPDPLAQPGTIRLLLSAGASKALTDSGEQCFQIVSRASYPACPDRWVVLLKPVPFKIAQAACNVALGSHRAVRIKPLAPAEAPE